MAMAKKNLNKSVLFREILSGQEEKCSTKADGGSGTPVGWNCLYWKLKRYSL